MKQIRLILLALVAFGFTSPAPIKLAYTFKAGESYLMSQTIVVQMKQSIDGMDQNMNSNTQADVLFMILEVSKETAKMEVSYTRLKNSSKSPQGNAEMDSEGTADTKENKLFKAMTNKPFYVWMNRLGKIEKIEGTDTLSSAFRDAGIDEASAGLLRLRLVNYMGDKAIKTAIQNVFIPYPENQIKKGDTWKNTQFVSVPYEFTTDDTWSLVAQDDQVIHLMAHGISTSDKEKMMDLPGGLKAKVDLAGNQTMKRSLNPKTNWPTSTESISEIKGKMSLFAGGQVPQDMEIPMDIHTETKSTITKK